MPRRVALLLAACALAGCVGHIQENYTPDEYKQMRADLKSCTLDDGAWAFAFIPDFGNTSDFHWTKCMRQRGWDSGWGSNGVRVYTRAWTPTQEPLGPQNARRPPADGCQPGALWNEVQETCMTIEPSPAWCRGTWTGVRCIR